MQLFIANRVMVATPGTGVLGGGRPSKFSRDLEVTGSVQARLCVSHSLQRFEARLTGNHGFGQQRQSRIIRRVVMHTRFRHVQQ
jgi:hypothetical protein